MTVPIPVTCYDGVSLTGREGTILVERDVTVLTLADETLEFETAALRASPLVARAPRFITLPNGCELECSDHWALEALPQDRTEGVVGWLEHRTWAAGVAIVLSVLGFLGLERVGVPLLADVAARSLSLETERELGEKAYAWVQNSYFLEASGAPAWRVKVVEEGFARLVTSTGHAQQYRLLISGAPEIGANAFAFPGGTVLVTDELFELCSNEEVLAVIAHEIGHVEERHALRQVLRGSATAALGSLLAGDVSSAGLAGIGLPIALSQAQYSREFEQEADEFAFRLLLQERLSPELFAKCLDKISTEQSEDETGFLASHPPSAERVARAREAAFAAGLQ